MIRVLVVDDDFRIAGIHAAYVDKVDGFQAIAQVHTAAEAIAAVCTCAMVWKPSTLST